MKISRIHCALIVLSASFSAAHGMEFAKNLVAAPCNYIAQSGAGTYLVDFASNNRILTGVGILAILGVARYEYVKKIHDKRCNTAAMAIMPVDNSRDINILSADEIQQNEYFKKLFWSSGGPIAQEAINQFNNADAEKKISTVCEYLKLKSTPERRLLQKVRGLMPSYASSKVVDQQKP